MYKCTKCGKEVNMDINSTKYSYGFIKGKPFVTILCDDCKKVVSESEYNKLKEKGIL